MKFAMETQAEKLCLGLVEQERKMLKVFVFEEEEERIS